MLKPQGYCKGCKDRRAEDPETGQRDCHRDCEKYKRFKKELAAWYQYYYSQRATAHLTDRRPWLGYKRGNKHD